MTGLSDAHTKWLMERKIPVEVAEEAGLWSSGAALGFPYQIAGELRFTKWRGPSKKFWIEPSKQKLILWNLDSLIDVSSDAPLIVCEGEMDCLAWMAAGAPAVVSVPNGGSSTTTEGDIVPERDTGFSYLWEGGNLVPEIARFGTFILSTDGDKTGQQLMAELAVRLGRDRCWYLTYPEGCKDANDVLMKHGIGGLAKLRDGARPVVPRKLVTFADIPMDNRQSYVVGWGGLDEHIRLRSPELVIITGASGSGKSQFALNVGANLARLHELKGALLQFEDHPERNREDLVLYAKAWANEIGDPEQWVSTMFRTIAPPEVTGDDERYTLGWLTETIREAARAHDCKWVVIDPWNEVEHLWGRSENESAYTNRALAELKSLARLLQIMLIVVTHPNKFGAVKTDINEMTLYDAAGSAAWRNKADHGIIMVRAEGSNDVYVKIDKVKDHRRMGFPGIVTMRFNPRHASYEFVRKGI